MKKTKKIDENEPRPLSQARDHLLKEFPYSMPSLYSLHAAARNEDFHHTRSSLRPKARIKVAIAELRRYVQSLSK